MAVIVIYQRGQQPWQVTSKGGALVLKSPKQSTSEIIELWGDTNPQARWQQFQDGREVATWESSQYDDSWPVTRKAVIQNGEVYAAGPPQPNVDRKQVLLCPVGKASEPTQARTDLRRYEKGIESLNKASRWSMLALGSQHISVIEPDEAGGLHSKELRDAKTSTAMAGRVEQIARNKLPSQVALIRTGDTPRHQMALLIARRTLSQWAGYAVHELTTEDVLADA